MTKPQSDLEKTRHEAQDLHMKISANIAKAEQATWADVKAVQADVATLVGKMKTQAEAQAEDARAGIKAAIGKLEAAGKLAENKTVAAKDDVRNANAALLEGAHKAAQSLSSAVAAARSRVAKAIAPEKVTA
jgi:hypothetical protein